MILEVEHIARLGWVKPLLLVAREKPRLQPLLARWRQHSLSDLAFAIETRFGYLPKLTRAMDEDMRALIDNVAEASTPLREFLDRRLALRVTDRKVLDRALISASVFVSESRAIFENLADFYGMFLAEVFSEAFNKKRSYEVVAGMAHHRRWVDALHEKRQLLLHYRSLWRAFDIDPTRVRLLKPIVLFNWRPGSRRAKDTLKVYTVREIQRWLPRVASAIINRLVRRVRALRPAMKGA